MRHNIPLHNIQNALEEASVNVKQHSCTKAKIRSIQQYTLQRNTTSYRYTNLQPTQEVTKTLNRLHEIRNVYIYIYIYKPDKHYSLSEIKIEHLHIR